MSLETTYTVTGKRSGQITFKFDLNGDLILFKYEGEPLSDKQRKWLYPRIPIHESKMNMWTCIKEFTVTKGEPDLSFDNFWNTYNEKQKRQVAEKLWAKLSNEDKYNAIAYIKRYDSLLKQKQTAKALPDTYLRQRRWLDEL